MSISNTSEILAKVEEIHDRHPFESAEGVDIAVVLKARRKAIDAEFGANATNHAIAILFRRETDTTGTCNLTGDCQKPVLWKPVQNDDLLGGGILPIESLSKEGLSEVWLAETSYWQKTLVVKYPKPKKVLQHSYRVALALAEARKLHGFSHKNVVQVSSVGYLDGPYDSPVPYIAMEYLIGCTLEEWRAARKAVSEKEAAQITRVILLALHALHSFKKGHILHLDLKPANVMVVGGRDTPADDNTIKLIDFASPGLEDGFQVHTPGYVASERFKNGPQTPTAGWDIYSVGGILWFLITREDPTQDKNHIPQCDWNRICDPFLRSICPKGDGSQCPRRIATALR